MTVACWCRWGGDWVDRVLAGIERDNSWGFFTFDIVERDNYTSLGNTLGKSLSLIFKLCFQVVDSFFDFSPIFFDSIFDRDGKRWKDVEMVGC